MTDSKNKTKSSIFTKKRLILIALILFGGAISYSSLIKANLLMPLSEIPKVLCLPSCEPEEAVHPTLEGKNLLNYEQILGQILSENSTSEKISILVEKSKLRLTIFQDLQAIKSYPIVLGGAPEGDKFREGDRRTPEGIYYVRDLYPHAAWSKFIWVDYPRPQSWREHFQAKFAGEIDWRSPIGGEIGIHGVPENGDRLIDEQNNWTLGCISLKNDDVDEIYQFIGHGTLIEILP